MLWVYGHYKYLNSCSAGIDFRRLKSVPTLKGLMYHTCYSDYHDYSGKVNVTKKSFCPEHSVFGQIISHDKLTGHQDCVLTLSAREPSLDVRI